MGELHNPDTCDVLAASQPNIPTAASRRRLKPVCYAQHGTEKVQSISNIFENGDSITQRPTFMTISEIAQVVVGLEVAAG